MTIRQLPNPKSQWFNSSGAPLSGGKIYTYEPGTSTAKNTYSDHLGATANANPVILDSRGEATIYWDGSYKVIVKDSADVTIYTLDNHGGGSIEDVSAQRSIVLNYSFEDDDDGDGEPDNWTVTLYTNGTQTLDTSAGGQIHGAKALKFTSTGTGGGYAESDLFLVHEAEGVTALWAMKSSDAAVRNLVELVWYDRSQSVLSTSSIYDDSTTNPTSWTDKTGSATAPSDARFAKLRLTGCHSSDATVGSTWFDDVRISPGFVTLTGAETLTNKTLTGATISVASGIGFPATQSASADANTLDDYEEGNWTPTVSFGGAQVGITYASQSGMYTKIGRMVFLSFKVELSNKGSSTGAAQINGTPVTSSAFFGGGAIGRWQNMTSALVYMGFAPDSLDGSGLSLYGATAGATTLAALTDAAFANTSIIEGSILMNV